MTQTHSEKAKQTIELMNTTADAWRLATIIWTKELATVPTKVQCPSCKGRGRVWVKGDLESWNVKKEDVLCAEYDTTEQVKAFLKIESRFLNMSQINQWEKESGNKLTQCPTCPSKRDNRRGPGEVVAFVERMVLVGRIKWDEGTQFTSRFHYSDGQSMTHCALCAKGINLSGRVPVQGTTRDGKAVGMFVGEDCARKILNVKAGLKKDQFIAENLKSNK